MAAFLRGGCGRAILIGLFALFLTACAPPALKPPPSPTLLPAKAVPTTSSGALIPAPPAPLLPIQPDGQGKPAVPQLMISYRRLLDALNAFYRGEDAPLQQITTPAELKHQTDLRGSWKGDKGQEALITPNVRVIRLLPDEATIADTSVYRTVWYRANGFVMPPVDKPVRMLQRFRLESGSWKFDGGLQAAEDVDIPDSIIDTGSAKP